MRKRTALLHTTASALRWLTDLHAAAHAAYSLLDAPGAFPTRSLRNLQRLYGLLPGINVAVKVPPRGVKKPIRVLGVFGDTVARLTRKARLQRR